MSTASVMGVEVREVLEAMTIRKCTWVQRRSESRGSRIGTRDGVEALLLA
jgi:hypothetical protein